MAAIAAASAAFSTLNLSKTSFILPRRHFRAVITCSLSPASTEFNIKFAPPKPKSQLEKTSGSASTDSERGGELYIPWIAAAERHNHPFHCGGGSDRWAHPSYASRLEATDKLASSICYDAAAILATTGEEIENLAAVQARLKRRSETAAIMVSELERERISLKLRSDAVCEEADRVLNWLKVYAEANLSRGGVDDAFEAVDKRSAAAMELLAADSAAEDVMYKLDGASFLL